MVSDWAATLRALGESFLDVLRAEVDALRTDVRESGRQAARGAKLTTIALFLAFWMLGLLLFALVALLATWMPDWAAALLVAGVLLLVITILGVAARSSFRRVQAPGTMAREHLDDHVRWLREELAMEDAEEPMEANDA